MYAPTNRDLLSGLIQPPRSPKPPWVKTGGIQNDPLFGKNNLFTTALLNNFRVRDTAADLAGQWVVRQTVAPVLTKALGGAIAGPVGFVLGGVVGNLLGGLFKRRRRPAVSPAALQKEAMRQGIANSLAQQQAKIDAVQNRALALTNQFIADTLRHVVGSNRYDAQRQGLMTLAVLPELAKAANQAQVNALQQQAGMRAQLAQLDQQRKLALAEMNLQAQMAHQQQQAQRQLAMANLVLPWLMGGMGLGTKQG